MVPTPAGVKPIKWRYVYIRMYNKDGSIKKYKARLVALDYGQVPGVDVFNTEYHCAITISISIYIQYAYTPTECI